MVFPAIEKLFLDLPVHEMLTCRVILALISCLSVLQPCSSSGVMISFTIDAHIFVV